MNDNSSRVRYPILMDFISVAFDNLAHDDSAPLPKTSYVANSWVFNYPPIFFLGYRVIFQNPCTSFHGSEISKAPTSFQKRGLFGRTGENRTLFQRFGVSVATLARPCMLIFSADSKALYSSARRSSSSQVEEMKRFELLSPIKGLLFSRQVVSSTHPHFQNQLTPIVHICWVLILRCGSATSH